MRDLQPRGHVPVDVAHVVFGLVFVEIGEVHAESAEERAVIALQHALEPLDHGPFEPAQQALGLVVGAYSGSAGGLGPGHAGSRPGPARGSRAVSPAWAPLS